MHNISVSEALEILKINKDYDINNFYNLSTNKLKKYYHIQALNYHPDKNKNENANEEFGKIQNAYELLYNILNKDDIENDRENIQEDSIDKYSELIINFVNLMINNLNSDQCKKRDSEKDFEKDFEKELEKFQKDCMDYSYDLIDTFLNNLNVEILEEIFLFLSFLSKNENKITKNINNISKDTIDYILNILEKKLKDLNLYIITPEIKNIINNEIYKLDINGEIVYIPLWHKELNYENNIIKIQPNLRENEKIDENNNLILNYFTNYENIIKKIREEEFPNLEIIRGNNGLDLDLKIPIDELYFTKKQSYIFKNIGISLVNNKDIMDISKKGDIIIIINII